MRNIRPAHYPSYKTNEWIGLATDDKAEIKDALQDGDLFYEMDTSKVLRYSKASDAWFNAPIGGGGGGSGEGTDNYNELQNKPKINGVSLIGDKNADDLGLVDVTDLAKKQDKLTAGDGINITDKTIKTTVIDDAQDASANKTYSINKIKAWVKDENAGISYKNLVDKPKIEGVEVNGAKTADELNLMNKTKIQEEFDKKQDKLTAGKNIKITGATIAADTIDDAATDSADKSFSINGVKTYVQTTQLIDYTKLKNIPKLEGVQIDGERTADYYGLAKKTDVDKKQDKLTAGKNVTIDANSKIDVDIIDDTVEESTTKVMSVTGIKKFVGAPMKYIGVLDTMSDLNTKAKKVAGYVYTITATKENYVYTADNAWKLLSSAEVDMSEYYTKTQTDTAIDTDVETHNTSTTAHADIREDVEKRVQKEDKAASADVTAGTANKWVDSALLKAEEDKLVKKSDKADVGSVEQRDSDKWINAALFKSFIDDKVEVDDKATEAQAKAYTADKWIDGVGLKAVLDNNVVQKADKATSDDISTKKADKWVDAKALGNFNETIDERYVKKSAKATASDLTAKTADKWIDTALIGGEFDKKVNVSDKATDTECTNGTADKWVDAAHMKTYAQSKITKNGIPFKKSSAAAGELERLNLVGFVNKDSDGDSVPTAKAVYDALPHLYEHNIDATPSGYGYFTMRFYSTSSSAYSFAALYQWIQARGRGVRLPINGALYVSGMENSVVVYTYLSAGDGNIQLRGAKSVLSSTVGKYSNRQPGYGWNVSNSAWTAFDSDGKSTITDTVVQIF